MKRRRRRRAAWNQVRPQDYEHRVECVIQALDHAVAGLRSFTFFLIEQQGTNWSDLDHLVQDGLSQFRTAVRWARKVNGPDGKKRRHR